MTTPILLASRVFTQDDQLRFAALSGDWNPMHVDQIASRRTAAGAIAVHGEHLLLWMVESLGNLLGLGRTVDGVKAKFLRWVYLGDPVELFLLRDTGAEMHLQIVDGGIAVTTATLLVGRRETIPPPPYTIDPAPSLRERHLADLPSLTGHVDLAASTDDWRREFPLAVRALGALELAGLACTSRLVGMECPGLHSICSSIAVTFGEDAERQSGLRYTVTAAHDLFRSVKMSIGGSGLTGTVNAFARVPPVAQQSIAEVAASVHPKEFAGAHVLIVGGSRGLGEFCAKALAAGGASVTITYAVGETEARRVAQEIVAWGGDCGVVPYDARAAAPEQLPALPPRPTHLYYFATSSIFRGVGNKVDPALFEDFLGIYVDGFYRLCEALGKNTTAAPLTIFYPSSSAVETRPPGMTEYAMAKVAGEALCSDLPRVLPGLRVVVKRLPRLPTDQTATLVPVQTASVPDTMLPIIREVQRAPDAVN